MNKFCQTTIIISLLLFSWSNLFAQERKITLDEILKNRSKALDPYDIYGNSQTYYKKERIEYKNMPDGVILNVISKFKAPNMIKTEMISNGQILNVRIFNGKEACEIIPIGNNVRKLEGLDLEHIRLQSEMANPKADYRIIFANIELSEAEDDNGKYFLLTCQPKQKDLPPIKIFIEQSSFLTMKVETISPVTGKKIVTEVKKYSESKGIKVAEETFVKTEDHEQTWTLEDFRLNILIDDMEFEIPKGK